MNLGITAISTFIGVLLGQFIYDRYTSKKETEYAQKHTEHIDVNNITDIHLTTNEDKTMWFINFTADNEEYSFDNIKKIIFTVNENSDPIVKISK